MGLSKAAAITGVLLCSGCTGSVLQPFDERDPREHVDGAIFTYYLARAELTFTATYDSKSKSLTVVPDTAIKAYPDFMEERALVYSHVGLSDDSVEVAAPGGLLTTLSSTSADKTTAAIEGLNAIISGASGVTSKGGSKTLNNPPAISIESKLPGPVDPIISDCDEDIVVTITVDITNGSVKDPIISKGSSKCELILKIDKPYIIKNGPQIIDFRQTDMDAAKLDRCEDYICFRLASVFQVTATAQMNVKAGVKRKLETDPPQTVPVRPGPVTGLNGAVGNIVPVQSTAQMLAPDKSRMGFVRFDRRAFVTNSTTIQFANGMLSDFKSTDPSEFVGFLTLPKDLLASVTLTVPLIK